MKTIHAALLAAASLVGFAASAQAQTQTKYFARERLVAGPSGTGNQDTGTPPATTPPKIYNSSQSTAYKNTKNVDGCGFSNDGTKSGFATAGEALDWCATVKVAYPSTQTQRMFCTLVILADNTYQASMSSSACNATFTGGQIWPNGTGQGHWMFTAIPSAYQGN